MTGHTVIGEETILKLADLARVELTPQEIAKFAGQLDGILKYIEKLNVLDTSNLEPLTSPFEQPMFHRPDEVHPSPGAAVILESAPEQIYDNYKVPPVIG